MGLPIADDGNGHNFFCALRLVVDSQATDHQKLFPQSARTKCVKPLISEKHVFEEGIAKWNELFIFEVPRKGLAKLEIEVTNLAAKAGKGEVVGASYISIGQGTNMLKKVASVRMLHASSDVQNIVSYPLRKRGQLSTDEGVQDYGCLLASTTYFERKTIANFQRDIESGKKIFRDMGFFVAFGPEGPWESFRSFLPLSIVPKKMKESFIAMEVTMKNGKKHAIFRGFAIVINDSDAKFDMCLCPLSMVHSHTFLTSEAGHQTVAEEEVFENQRYQPISGWGNKWPGFRGNDPAHWSTGDFSYSSKEFFEPSLPPGWQWKSTWAIDKSQFVDSDGWAYGPDYQSLKWPLTTKLSIRSPNDFARRRRWVRMKQRLNTESSNRPNNEITVLSPGSSTILPWRCMEKDSDLCLQVRPYVEFPETPYSWGHTVFMNSGYASGNDQSISDPVLKLNQIEKKDMLLNCNPNTGNKQSFWLSIGTDASVLHTELNTPVYDWKISINAPLKLENRLPCPAEFTIWERTKEGSNVDRQHGIISSRGNAHIYSANLQKPIYLTLFLQGGWSLEKQDPILILDQLSLGHVSSFWMYQQQSNRKLRVNIERDMGGTNTAPNTIRFFVPYWISNDWSLSLAYRMVEVEPLENPTNSNERKIFGPRKNVQVLDDIGNSSQTPIMLSPQDYVGRGNVLSFPSRGEGYPSRRVGISVATRHSEHYSPGISLLELENKERVDVKAFTSNGSYYKLSAVLNMTSERTKVIHFQPQCVFINRVGISISLRQCDVQSEDWFHFTDPPKPFQWRSINKVELLKLRLDGYKWSAPFSIASEGIMCVSLKNDIGCDQMDIRVEVRSGTKSSRYEVVFCHASFSSPYRIENRSIYLPIRFRQVDGLSDSWRSLSHNSAASFSWEDLGRKRLLEVLVDGTDPLKSEKYNIDEIFDHQPIHATGGPVRALRVTVVKEEKTNVVKISDWMPDNEPRSDKSLAKLSRNNSQKQQPTSADSEFHVILELPELGLSIIDHTPEEILYLSVQNLLISHSSGLGSGISRFKIRMHGIQADNQLPLTPMPVLFRPQRLGEQLDYILKLSVTTQTSRSLDLCNYPYIGFHVPENSAFFVNIHEPIIWRIHEMIQQINPSRLRGTQTTAVSVDPIVQIGVLNISEIRFKVSMTMSPTQRPRGVLGFWSSLMTALGNTENMPVRVNQRFHEEICMRQSALVSTAIANVNKDLLNQPLQLLSGVDILGNASSALGHMSKGVAALSMDKKFIQNRQKQVVGHHDHDLDARFRDRSLE
ncbi:hypothetical protein GIB67_011306 [Kingdonia uniflora]|uniref:Vacuolar protein sorting-associated protein 13 VPS13 adaptor binding domain-containing protein n=1 Tax=Kingdonia uniflora TaxID=39325 RepID=A0A7J7MNH3_9MAGN|nr:hypothetical protein GIB67_011306 [Kingdonia uniflora]